MAAPTLTQETIAAQPATICDHYKPFQPLTSHRMYCSTFSEPNVHNPMLFCLQNTQRRRRLTSYNSLRSQSARSRQSTVTDCWISIVAEYLDLMGVRYSLDRRRRAFELFKDENGKSQSVMSIAVLPSGYVLASTTILTVEQIRAEERLHVYEKLLEANWKMPEARYAINSEGYISVTLRSTVDSVARENFRSLHQTLVNGVNHFFTEIAPDLIVKKSKQRSRSFIEMKSTG